MKKIIFLPLMATLVLIFGCEKEDRDTPFKLLTDPVWATDSLLVNGQDASGAGQLLENFKGDVKFNKDGSGSFGNYTGTWRFAQNETQIIITTTELPLPLTTIISTLTRTDLKVNTAYPNPENLMESLQIRMTFKAK